jgi:hypothetical protein
MADNQDRSRQNGASRDRYRDNDDVRDPIEGDQRNESKPDTKSEARGDARENVGNHSRGTAAAPTGPEGNDNTAHRGEKRPRD